MTSTTSRHLPHVVVVGGGFGGLFAARRLARGPVRVTVLDRTGIHLFQPLLYQVATGALSEGQISAPLRHLFRRSRSVQCLVADVHDIDVAAQVVHARRPDGGELTTPYDYLIVAAGVQQSYFGHDEFARHARGMKSIDDALSIRRRIYQAFETAEALPDPDQRRPWLTFALVGAGPTGVELAGQLREVATRTLREEFRAIDPAEARVLLLEGGDTALAGFPARLAGRAVQTLRRLGVELHLGARVTDVDGDGLSYQTHDQTTHRLATRTVLWTAGVHAPPLADALARATGTPQSPDGRLQVQPDLTLPGHPEIFVVGDLASLDDLPGVAEVALQGGRYAARQILRRLTPSDAAHRDPAPPEAAFHYRDLGSAAYVSRGHALLQVGPVRLWGRPGWLAWGLIHLAFLSGYRNRAAALTSWLVTLAASNRRERVFPTVTSAQST